MNITSLHQALGLKHPEPSDLSNKDDKKLREACVDFEAILLDSMFQAMRKTLTGEDIFGNSLGKDIYESMYYREISNQVAKDGRGLGIGDMLFQQLQKNRE